MMIAFFIWAIVGIAFLALGIFDYMAKTEVPAGFWANAKTIPVEEEDVPAYNRAVGKLWIVYGVLFLLFGLPLLAGQNSPLIFIKKLTRIPQPLQAGDELCRVLP